MRHLYFIYCPVKPDLWMRPAKRSNVSEYYEYSLIYTYDVIVFSDSSEQALQNDLGHYFTLK